MRLHGYVRVCVVVGVFQACLGRGKFILYTFWKNAIITMLLFYYTFFSGYSGTCHFTALGSKD